MFNVSIDRNLDLLYIPSILLLCLPYVLQFTGHLSAEDVNMILAQLEAGVDLALQRAKAWSKYAKDVVSYIERKCQFGKTFYCLHPGKL